MPNKVPVDPLAMLAMVHPLSPALTLASTPPVLTLMSAAPDLSYKSEHLVWQPGFGRAFASSVALIALLAPAVVRAPAVQTRAAGGAAWAAAKFECWALLGLLSSSCCLLQLALNMLSVGCAGFNTVLGPLRPQLLALTAVLQAFAWRAALLGRAPAQLAATAASTALAASLALLPEGLHLWIHRTDGASGELSGERLALQVSGMGCTACIAKVKGALETVDGVRAPAVRLEDGVASFHADKSDPEAAAAVEARAVRAVEAAGFGACPLRDAGE